MSDWEKCPTCEGQGVILPTDEGELRAEIKRLRRWKLKAQRFLDHCAPMDDEAENTLRTLLADYPEGDSDE